MIAQSVYKNTPRARQEASMGKIWPAGRTALDKKKTLYQIIFVCLFSSIKAKGFS